MTQWHIRPVKRDQGGTPTTVDIRSKLSGALHAHAKPGTQFVMPDFVLKKGLTDKERLAILRALRMPETEDKRDIEEFTKLFRLLETLKVPINFETMRRNRKWSQAKRWKLLPAVKL